MSERPKIVCLCGSTRFYEHFQSANYEQTMAGNIVLSVGFYPHAQKEIHHSEDVGCTAEQKIALDALHKRKIDLADEVFVLNVGGYIGSSTHSEIDYAIEHGKPVRYLETPAAPHVEHFPVPDDAEQTILPPQRSMTPEESANLAAYHKTKFKRVAGGAIEGEPRRLNTHDVFLSVYEDIKQRNELGWAQHAKPLNVDDKSLLKWLEEAYEETLDKAVYLKGAILRLKGDSNV